jgi:hypothetical protein
VSVLNPDIVTQVKLFKFQEAEISEGYISVSLCLVYYFELTG